MDSIVRFLFLSTDGVEISGAHFSLGARYRHFSPTTVHIIEPLFRADDESNFDESTGS